jgi:hypothetical protein
MTTRSCRARLTLRILAINDSSDDCHAVWTVETELVRPAANTAAGH